MDFEIQLLIVGSMVPVIEPEFTLCSPYMQPIGRLLMLQGCRWR